MATAASVFVPTVECVRRSIEQLMAVHANAVTPGYLCVLNAATKAHRVDKLRPRFRHFFDRHFRAGEVPENKPYVVPFGRTETGDALLFNRNVAGSYAPSSMRDVNPLFDVLEIHHGDYTLLEDHAVGVRDRILPRPLPACATACAKKGVPLAILDEASGKLYMAVAADLKNQNDKLMPFVEKKVKATGILMENGGIKGLAIKTVAAATP